MKTKINKFGAFAILGLMLGVMMIGFTSAVLTPQSLFGSDDNISIVVGENSAASDHDAAERIADELAGTSMEAGEGFEIRTGTNRLNIGENITDVKSNIDGDDLTILEDQVFTTDDNDDFDYEQDIDFSDGLLLEWFDNNDLNDGEPAIGIEIENDQPILNYTLDFSDNPDSEVDNGNLVNFEDSEITILGREYTILTADNDADEFELLGGAVNDILEIGESQTYDIDGESITVEAIFIDDDEARFRVNGESTDSLQEGESSSVAGTEIAVREVNFQDFAGGIQQVEFTIGAQTLNLIDGDEIELNDEVVDGMFAHINRGNASGGNVELESIVIEWRADDDMFITEEEELVMPIFGLAIRMDEFVTESEEQLMIEFDGEETLSTNVNVEDGNYDLPILSGDGTTFTTIGESDDQQLVTSSTDTLTFDTDTDDLFVASWNDGDEAESFILRVTDVNEDNGDVEVTIENVITGDDQTEEVDGTMEFGNVEITIDDAVEADNTATLVLTSDDSSFNQLFTKEGLTMFLPVDAANGTATGEIDLGSDTTYDLVFMEEDEDENIAAGEEFTIPLSWSSDEMQVSGTNGVTGNLSGDGFLELEEDQDLFVAYVASPLATRIEIDTDADQNPTNLIYHGSEAYGRIIIGEEGARVNNTGDNNETDRVQIITPDEIESGMNLITIGGSCVNSFTAEILGLDYPTCGEEFTDETGVNEGEFILTRETEGGRDVIVIAGYSAEDTEDAADEVIESEGDFTERGINMEDNITNTTRSRSINTSFSGEDQNDSEDNVFGTINNDSDDNDTENNSDYGLF